MFFVKKKRCKYCASVLVDGKCTNSNCINYSAENSENRTEAEEKQANE